MGSEGPLPLGGWVREGGALPEVRRSARQAMTLGAPLTQPSPA
jgi:hypothetical protein